VSASDAPDRISRIIETPRLRIAPFGAKHLTERYVGWLNDPLNVRYSEQRYRTHTLESCRAYYESFRGTPHFFWAVEARDPELGHVGNMNAYVEPHHRLADVGILIGEPAARGHGFGGEAWAAVCRYLLEEEGMRKVTAGTLRTNTGMLAIMERCGMTPDGVRARQLEYDGEEVDVVYAAFFAGQTVRTPGAP
jgi:RimJ/RimL family protein N-acetyltransferase